MFTAQGILARLDEAESAAISHSETSVGSPHQKKPDPQRAYDMTINQLLALLDSDGILQSENAGRILGQLLHCKNEKLHSLIENLIRFTSETVKKFEKTPPESKDDACSTRQNRQCPTSNHSLLDSGWKDPCSAARCNGGKQENIQKHWLSARMI